MRSSAARASCPACSYEEITYEGYGPGGAALIIETLTDNKNRTVGEIRHLLAKYGGNLAAENSVAWMFDKKGYIVVDKAKADEEALMAAAIDAGADDMRDDGDSWEIVSRARRVPEGARRGQGARTSSRARRKSRCCRRTTSSSKASRRSRWSG